MQTNERISLDKFFQLHGRHVFADRWNDYAIYFLKSEKPTLIGFDFSTDELRQLIAQGEVLNKMARQNAIQIDSHFIKHLDKVFVSDNFKTSYEFHGEVAVYDYMESECIDTEGKSRFCQITLKSSSEFIDKESFKFFDQKPSPTQRKNNKMLLVAKGVLMYFDRFGIPAQSKQLVSDILKEYQKAYGENVSEKQVYEVIAVMSDFWNNKSKN